MRAMSLSGRHTILNRLMLVLALAWGTVGVAQADEPSYPERIGTKLFRGMINLTTGVGEFPKQIYLVAQKEGWMQGLVRGPVEGLGMFIARTVAGAYEVATFPLPIPPGYQPMLLPEYVWQPEPPSQVTVPADPAAPTLQPDGR